MIKKAKKLSFDTQYQTTIIDDVKIDVEGINASKGKYIIQTIVVARYITVKKTNSNKDENLSVQLILFKESLLF